jgi:hypothetical protein
VVSQKEKVVNHPEKIGGKKALKEWSDATDFTSLPKKAKKRKKTAKGRSGL